MPHITTLVISLLLALHCSEGYRVRKRIKISDRKKEVVPSVNNNLGQENQKSARFLNPFSLFHVIQFPNTECETTDGNQGTCYTSSECLSRGGTSNGGCASGFGVCCSFVEECGGETYQNGTYFISPSSLTTQRCEMLINPLNENICQVRIEFESLSLMDPDTNGACDEEYVSVALPTLRLPRLCGSLDGQHVIYTPLSKFPARLIVMLSSETVTANSGSWRLKVLQYSCDSPVLAPEGCLQFFTGISGSVSSFNFKTEENANGADFPNMISDLNYNICLRQERGYCSVEWSTGAPFDQLGMFSLTTDGSPATTVSGTTGLNGDTNCATDYVMIPQGGDESNPSSTRKDRYCGQGLAFCTDDSCSSNTLGAVSSSVLPFTLLVVTDSEVDVSTDKAIKGFNLQYQQQSC